MATVSGELFFSLIGSVLLLVAGGMDERNMDVSRINYGVRFNYLRTVRVVNGVYRHSFNFEIPTEPFHGRHHAVTHGFEANIGWLTNCFHYWDLVAHPGHGQEKGRPHQQTNGSSLCVKHSAEIVQLLKVAKEDHDQLDGIVAEINSLLPLPVFGRAKSKRSLIPLIGRVASSLFGMATDAHLSQLSEHLRSAMTLMKGQSKNFTYLSGNLASYSKKTDTRMQDLTNQMKLEALHNIQNFAEMYQGERSVEFQLALERKARQLKHVMDKAKFTLKSFYESMQQLTAGRLPSQLLTKEMLEETLQKISENKSFHLVMTNAIDYYKQGHFVYTQTNGHLVITLEFPWSYYPLGFNTYQIKLIDMLVPNLAGAAMRLTTSKRAIAIQTDKTLFYFPTDMDILEVNGLGQYRSFKRSLQKVSSNECLIAIYLNSGIAVKENCDYQIILNGLKPSVHWIEGDQFLLTKIATMNIRCRGLGGGSLNGCDQCVVVIPPNCWMETRNTITMMNAGGIAPYGNNTRTRALDVFYTVNRPILTNFFSENELNSLQGENLLEEKPNIALPAFQIYEPHTLNDTIKEGARIISLQKMIIQLKKEKMLIYDAAEISIKDRDISESKDWSKYHEWLTIALAIVNILLIIQVSYLTGKGCLSSNRTVINEIQ